MAATLTLYVVPGLSEVRLSLVAAFEVAGLGSVFGEYPRFSAVERAFPPKRAPKLFTLVVAVGVYETL